MNADNYQQVFICGLDDVGADLACRVNWPMRSAHLSLSSMPYGMRLRLPSFKMRARFAATANSNLHAKPGGKNAILHRRWVGCAVKSAMILVCMNVLQAYAMTDHGIPVTDHCLHD